MKGILNMSILQTIDLKKYYGTEPNITRALDGVNFSVEDGEFVDCCRNFRQWKVYSASHDGRTGYAHQWNRYCSR